MERTTNDCRVTGVSGRRTDHIESVHSPGAALCVRAFRTEVSDQRAAAAGGNGGYVRRNRHTGRRGRGVGGSVESIWTRGSAGVARRLRRDVVVAAPGRWVVAPLRGRWQSSASIHVGRHGQSRILSFAAARRRHRSVVGPLRGSDSWLGADGCRHFGAECPHYLASVLLCRRCSDLTGGRHPRRRPGIRNPEEIAGCGRMAEAGAGRRCIACGDCHRLRLGQQHPHALVTGRDQPAGTIADRRNQTNPLTQRHHGHEQFDVETAAGCPSREICRP